MGSNKYLKTLLPGIFMAITGLLLLPVVSQGAGYLSELVLQEEVSQVVDISEELPSLSGSFLAGQIASKNNDDKAAIDHFTRAIELDPENHNLKQSLFAVLTSKGQINEAIALLEQIPPEAQTQVLNGIVLSASAIKQKSWKQAIAHIDKIDGKDLDIVLSKLIGSWAYFGNRNLEEAIARANEISGPDWTMMIKQYHIGLMNSALGNDAEAIAAFEQALSYRSFAIVLAETYIRAGQGLARSYARTGDTDKALSTIKEGLQLIPQHPPLVELAKMIESEQAIQPLVSTAQQGAAEIFFNVGSVVSRQGGLAFAQSNLQISRYLYPENNVALLSLADVYSNSNKPLEANLYYGEVEPNTPFSRRAQLETAMNLNRLKQFPEAEKILLKLIDENPDDIFTVLSLGGIYSTEEEFQKASRVYDRTIARINNPERRHWNIFYRRGIAHERSKKWDKAEADFKKSLELFPDQPDVLNYLGYSWVDKAINLDEGLEMIKKAVELKPNSGFIIDSLGWAYYRLGKFEESATELEKAVQLMPFDPVINDHLGDAYWQIGRKLEATFLWKHALSKKPSDEDKAKITSKLQNGLTN